MDTLEKIKRRAFDMYSVPTRDEMFECVMDIRQILDGRPMIYSTEED